MNPADAVKQLGDAVFHVQMKDNKIDPATKNRNGVIDTKPFGDEHTGLGRFGRLDTVTILASGRTS